MLCSFMKDMIIRDVQCSLIITKKGVWVETEESGDHEEDTEAILIHSM